MPIKGILTISKDQSQNATYIDTAKWQKSDKVIQITTQNGGVESTDEIPSGGVKEKIANQEEQIQNNNKSSIPSNPNVNLNQEKNEISTSARPSEIPRLTRTRTSTNLNKTPETIQMTQRTKSDLSLRKPVSASSKLDNYLGANHQIGRNFPFEVRTQYPLNPVTKSKSKINSNLFSPASKRKVQQRNFVIENINASKKLGKN